MKNMLAVALRFVYTSFVVPKNIVSERPLLKGKTMTVLTQTLVKKALTSRALPAPDPLKDAGFTKYDLEQQFRHYINELSEKRIFCANPYEERNYERKMELADRNYQHLSQRL